MLIQYRCVAALMLAVVTAFAATACKQDEDTEAPPDRAEAAALEAVTERAPSSRPAEVCPNCGTVAAIETVRTGGEASGAGAVMGAVVGGVIGHQFGKGKGKDAATAAAAIGGAFAGQEAEKQVRATEHHQVMVRMDDTSTRVVHVATAEGLAVGSKVRVFGENIELR